MPQTRLQHGRLIHPSILPLLAIVLALALFAPEAVLAAEASFSATQFTPTQDDYSLNVIIKRVLGDVVDAEGNVVAAGNLGEIFRAFNQGVAFFGTIIVMFVTVVGTMQTANDGEFLGRRWSSMWVPVRFAGASAMLLPLSASGYSMIQGLILWVATQGIGFADTVWAAALKNIYGRNQITVSSSIPAEQMVADVMRSSLCLAFINQAALESGDPENSKRTPVLRRAGTAKNPEQSIHYGECGKISMASKAIDAETTGRSSEDIKRLEAARGAVSAVHFKEMQDISDRFMVLATEYVLRTRGQDLVEQSGGQGGGGQAGATATAPGVELQKLSDEVLIASNQYVDRVQSAAQRAVAELSSGGGLTAEIANKGWVMAGTFYMELSRHHAGVIAGITTAPSITPPDIEVAFGGYREIGSYYVAAERGLLTPTPRTQENRARITEARAAVGNLGGARVQDVSFTDIFKSGASDPSNFVPTVSQRISEYVISSFASVNDRESVVIQVKNKGDIMLSMAAAAFTLEITGSFLSNLKKSMDGNPIGWITSVGTGWLSAIIDTIGKYLMAIGVVFAAAGMMLAVYTPMVPYILWLAGVVGWTILLMEALVAGPLWMVMHMSPSGEGIAGDKAQQGYMLLLVLFARPALMIMGFIAAIFMIEPLIGFLNDTFFLSMRSVQASNNSMSGLFVTVGFAVLYVGLVIMVMHKCFAMSHAIPDNVLGWIGGGKQLGEAGADNESKTMVVGAMHQTSNVLRSGKISGAGDGGAKKLDGTTNNIGDPKDPKGGGSGPGNDGLQVGQLATPAGAAAQTAAGLAAGDGGGAAGGDVGTAGGGEKVAGGGGKPGSGSGGTSVEPA